MTLENKVAVITGAAHGIGYAIAKRFVDVGCNVMLADIDEKAGEEAAESLKQKGNVEFIHCNVGERLGVRNMVSATIDTFGHIDILVNNAGIASASDFLDVKLDDFDRIIKVNLRGPFLCSQAVARHMVERLSEGTQINGACIINISSINSILAVADQAPYSVSKGGLNQLTRVCAVALAPYGIRVNAIGPGAVDTKLLTDIIQDQQTLEKVMLRTPLGRLGKASEIASVAAFLASEDAGYITGQVIFADGGRLPLNFTNYQHQGE
ncbi:SDR family NAD(P)-dependent oxidoreductase [Flexibacterium corallicola]|uniref:SDR family NAD(P)-dependent oxidoreductase n=1 Tax=Flexibacterium corallicola TaxID=3037259 RepID=UPI00286EC92D|nr:glucose 1-dehydrogenase [Pseudovibrio sp. M1P-2-3]